MQQRKKVLFGAMLALSTVIGAGVAQAASSGSLLPSGVGNYNQFPTTVGTTTHYLNVDETACNGVTDYNQTSTVGHRDSYRVSLAGIPDGAVITAIAIKPCAGRAVTGGTNPVMNVFYRANGVNSADAGAYAISLATPADLATTTYSGLSISKIASTTLEVGAVLTSGTKGIRLSRIHAVLTYETAPSAPTSLTASTSLISTTTINLSWADNSSNETSFKVERGTDGINFTQIGSTTANVTAYSNSGLAPGIYYYRVRASNTAGNSGYSNVASATIASLPPTIPADPSALSAVASSTSAFLSWTDNSSNETSFKIERGTSTFSFALIATTTANQAFYSDFGVTSGTTYFYRVSASNAVGDSGYSNTASTTIP